MNKVLEKIDKQLELYEAYIVAQNPNDNLWYALGDIKAKGKTYWIPVSRGYSKKEDAEAFAKKQPEADKAAKKWAKSIAKSTYMLDEAVNPMMKFKAQDAAGKIMGLDVNRKGSVRELLVKAGAIKSVSESIKLINKMADIIMEEMG